jgi:hypothetical protein
MHVRTQIKDTFFEVAVDESVVTPAELFPGWHRHDRFGMVIHHPLGGVGASHLSQLAAWSFYEADVRRRTELRIYPESYAFHVGGGRGSMAAFDYWPMRHQVIVDNDAGAVLEAINDRGITRLAVPDTSLRDHSFHEKEISAAHDLWAQVFAYSPSGRTRDGNVSIRGRDRRSEVDPRKVLDPHAYGEVEMKLAGNPELKESDADYLAYQAARAREVSPEQVAEAVRLRDAISVDGTATETYRLISVREALRRLAYDE